MALPRTLTVIDLYVMPERGRGERYELNAGELLVTPLPTWRHQSISANLFGVISAHVHTVRLG